MSLTLIRVTIGDNNEIETTYVIENGQGAEMVNKEAFIFGLESSVFRLKKSTVRWTKTESYKVRTEFDINVQLKLNGAGSTKTGPS